MKELYFTESSQDQNISKFKGFQYFIYRKSLLYTILLSFWIPTKRCNGKKSEEFVMKNLRKSLETV